MLQAVYGNTVCTNTQMYLHTFDINNVSIVLYRDTLQLHTLYESNKNIYT